jgi:hypothetical protein
MYQELDPGACDDIIALSGQAFRGFAVGLSGVDDTFSIFGLARGLDCISVP